MGTIPDSRRREKLARIDDTHQQSDIELARKFIFENGAPVAGAHVEAVLNPKSRVPTRVSISGLSFCVTQLIFFFRMHFRSAFYHFLSITIQCL